MLRVLMILFFLVSGNSFAYGQLYFQKTYQAGFIQFWGKSIKQTNDHGYIIGGNYIPGLSWSDYSIVNTDSIGEVIWAKGISVPGLPGIGILDDLIISVTGDFLIVGLDRDTGIGGALAIMIDSNGTLKWLKCYESSWIHSAMQTADIGFFMCGWSCGGLSLIRTNQNGDTLWTKTIHGLNDEMIGSSIIQSYDDNFIISGYSSPFTGGPSDIILTKVDGNGNVIWIRKFDGLYYDHPSNIIETRDSGLALAGTRSVGNGNGEIIVIRADSFGNILWSKKINGLYDDNGTSIIEDSDGNLVIGGSTSSFGNTSDNALIIKIDLLGNIIWSNTFDDASIESLAKTSDGGFATCGVNHVNQDLHLIKTDSMAVSLCNELSVQILPDTAVMHETIPGYFIYHCNSSVAIPSITISDLIINENIICTSLGAFENEQVNALNIFPNPATSSITISSNSILQESRVEVYNLLGEKIYSSDYSEPLTINCEHFPIGCYFIKLQSPTGFAVQKFIKK